MWWYALPISLFAAYGLLIVWSSSQAARTRDARKNYTLEAFKRALSDKNYDPKAVEGAYKDLVQSRGHPAFPQDELERTLGFLPEDFEDMLDARAQQLGVLDVLNSSYASLFPINSVEDYVRFLSAVIQGEQERPRKGETTWPKPRASNTSTSRL